MSGRDGINVLMTALSPCKITVRCYRPTSCNLIQALSGFPFFNKNIHVHIVPACENVVIQHFRPSKPRN